MIPAFLSVVYGAPLDGSSIGTFQGTALGLAGLSVGVRGFQARRRASSLARDVTVVHALNQGVPVGKDLLKLTQDRVLRHYGPKLKKVRREKNRAMLLEEVKVFEPLFDPRKTTDVQTE